MEELLKRWNIGPISSIEPLDSFTGKVSRVCTKAGQVFILKEKDDQVKADREASLLQELASAGAPVAVPERTATVDCTLLDHGKSYLLYPQLPGEPVTEHYGGDAAARAEVFGRAIASLHGWLLKINPSDQFPRMNLPEQIRQWALPCCKMHLSTKPANALKEIWARLDPDWTRQYEQLPRQLIHRDAHPGNMPFKNGHLSGFIDFDQAMEGPRLFDLCYCATALLVGGFRETRERNAWPVLLRALVKGYEAVNPLTPNERDAIPGMLMAIELLFAAFCLESGEAKAARLNVRVFHWLAENRNLFHL